MQGNLMANSSVYAERAELYDLFSKAEDADNGVFKALLTKVSGKTVLDIGCGTGKYLSLFSPHVAHITGIDIAAQQLQIARHKTINFKNVAIIEGDAATAPLPLAKYDVIISTWAIGTILDATHRQAVLDRMDQLLAPGGSIFMVENDTGGAFEDIRGRLHDPLRRTQNYNAALLADGFDVFARFTSRFAFASAEQAKEVFRDIWGDTAAAKITKPEIEHKIIIFTKSPQQRSIP